MNDDSIEIRFDDKAARRILLARLWAKCNSLEEFFVRADLEFSDLTRIERICFRLFWIQKRHLVLWNISWILCALASLALWICGFKFSCSFVWMVGDVALTSYWAAWVAYMALCDDFINILKHFDKHGLDALSGRDMSII